MKSKSKKVDGESKNVVTDQNLKKKLLDDNNHRETNFLRYLYVWNLGEVHRNLNQKTFLVLSVYNVKNLPQYHLGH